MGSRQVRSSRFVFVPVSRARRALETARVIEDVVERQLRLLPLLPERSRPRAADHLAELVLLAGDYRHYARGWIDKRELVRRGRETVDRLALLRASRSESAHLTD